MTREELQAMLDDHFEGLLNPEESAALRSELQAYPDLAAEYSVWEDLPSLAVEEPGPGLSLRLAEALQTVKREERAHRLAGPATWWERTLERFWPAHPAYSFAAATLCLVLGLAGGWMGARGWGGASSSTGDWGSDDAVLRELRAEVRDTRELAILTMLQQDSATDRLRGVSYTRQLSEPNTAVLGALIRTLRYDTSVDVRLASIEALSRHRDQATVRSAFLEAVTDSSASPLVQVELIVQLGRTNDPQARLALEQMAVNEKLDPTVRLAAARQVQATL